MNNNVLAILILVSLFSCLAMENPLAFRDDKEAFTCSEDYEFARNGKTKDVSKSIDCLDWIIKNSKDSCHINHAKLMKGKLYWHTIETRPLAHALWKEVLAWTEHTRKSIDMIQLLTSIALNTAEWVEKKDITIHSRFQICLAIANKLNNITCKSQCLYMLGQVAEADNDILSAKTYYEQVVSMMDSEPILNTHAQARLDHLCQNKIS